MLTVLSLWCLLAFPRLRRFWTQDLPGETKKFKLSRSALTLIKVINVLARREYAMWRKGDFF